MSPHQVTLCTCSVITGGTRVENLTCPIHAAGDGGVLPATPDVMKVKGACPACGYLRADAALVAPREPSEQPKDASGKGRLLLNAYGRTCYRAGQDSITGNTRPETIDIEIASLEESRAYWRDEYERSNAEHRQSLTAAEAVLAGLRGLIAQCEQDVLALPIHGHAEHESGHPRALVFKVDVLKLLALAGRTETP